jgi:hypothetical protein
MFEDIHNGLDIAKDMNEYLYKIYHLAVNPAKAITKEEFEEERNRRNQDTLSSEIEYYGEDF